MSDLRRRVLAALDHAKKDGHFSEGHEIVCDMLVYDDELEDCEDCACLEPFVVEWMRANDH